MRLEAKIKMGYYPTPLSVVERIRSFLKFPEDNGKMCQWLLDSMNSMIHVLKYGGTLPWTYSDTPYEKKVDPNGLTTEFVRCPDPTARIVAKITRTPSSNG